MAFSIVTSGAQSVEIVQPLLVVEDEPLIRLDLVEILEAGGYSADQSASARAAVSNIQGRDVLHGVVTDIKLGAGEKGWHVARVARQKFPDIAVVYITGDSAAEWPAEGVPNSIVLQKPFADAQLLSAIATLLCAAGPQPGSAD